MRENLRRADLGREQNTGDHDDADNFENFGSNFLLEGFQPRDAWLGLRPVQPGHLQPSRGSFALKCAGEQHDQRRVAANGIKMPILSRSTKFANLAHPSVTCRAFDDKFAHLNDWAILDAMFPADLMLDKLDGLFQPIDKPMGKSRLRRVVKRRPRRTGGEPPC